jgi:hypothetical protein
VPRKFGTAIILPGDPGADLEAVPRQYVTTVAATKQPLDSDLTTIASLSPSDDDLMQRISGAWANRTPAQVKTSLSLAKGDVGLGNVDNTSDVNKPVSTATQTALDAKQAGDADLTAIAGLSPSNDDVIQRKSGAWTNRTMAQVKTDLALSKSDVGLGNVDNTADSAKPVSTAQQTALDAKVPTTRSVATSGALSGGGDLSADRTLTIAAGAITGTEIASAIKDPAAATAGLRTLGTAATQATAGDDSRLSDARTPTGTAGGALNGTYPNPALDTVPWGPVALSDAATIATDASLGNHFRVTLGGNRTLGNPTNPTDGQRATWELIQDGTGSRTITLDTAFGLGTDITAVTLTTTASKRDFLGAIYNSTTSKWYIIAFLKGY